MLLNEKTTATVKTTTEADNRANMSAFETHCRRTVDEAPVRLAAMVRELSDIAEAAGEVYDTELMDRVMECRAALIRVIEGPAATDREAGLAWKVLGGDAEGRRIQRAIGAMLANLAAEHLDDAVPGSLMFDGDHEAVTGYGDRKGLNPRAIAKDAARKAGKAKRATKAVRK